jgi:hypothetical protein|tara:strand:- start:445 stop:699 length:255 start_codon:yes stop_codon:yes gene_type:complete
MLSHNDRCELIAECTQENNHWGAAVLIAEAHGRPAELELLRHYQHESKLEGFTQMEHAVVRQAVVSSIMSRLPDRVVADFTAAL